MATAPRLAAGAPVRWTYRLTTSSLTPVTVVSVIDDNATPGDASDDWAALALTTTFAGSTFNAGDTNYDGLLGAGETWLYTSAGVAAAPTTRAGGLVHQHRPPHGAGRRRRPPRQQPGLLPRHDRPRPGQGGQRRRPAAAHCRRGRQHHRARPSPSGRRCASPTSCQHQRRPDDRHRPRRRQRDAGQRGRRRAPGRGRSCRCSAPTACTTWATPTLNGVLDPGEALALRVEPASSARGGGFTNTATVTCHQRRRPRRDRHRPRELRHRRWPGRHPDGGQRRRAAQPDRARRTPTPRPARCSPGQSAVFTYLRAQHRLRAAQGHGRHRQQRLHPACRDRDRGRRRLQHRRHGPRRPARPHRGVALHLGRRAHHHGRRRPLHVDLHGQRPGVHQRPDELRRRRHSPTATTPTSPRSPVGVLTVKKAVNAVNPLAPTAAEDANDPANARAPAQRYPLVFTYLVSGNATSRSRRAAIVLVDDNGTPTDRATTSGPSTSAATATATASSTAPRRGSTPRPAGPRLARRGPTSTSRTVTAGSATSPTPPRRRLVPRLRPRRGRQEGDQRGRPVPPDRARGGRRHRPPALPRDRHARRLDLPGHQPGHGRHPGLGVRRRPRHRRHGRRLHPCAGAGGGHRLQRRRPRTATRCSTPARLALHLGRCRQGRLQRDRRPVHLVTRTVDGREPRSGATATSSDPSLHFGAAHTGSSSRRRSTPPTRCARPRYEDADNGPGPVLLAGSAVVWTYLVTNPGTTPLDVVGLQDDNGTGDPSQGFVVDPVDAGDRPRRRRHQRATACSTRARPGSSAPPAPCPSAPTATPRPSPASPSGSRCTRRSPPPTWPTSSAPAAASRCRSSSAASAPPTRRTRCSSPRAAPPAGRMP